MSQSPAANDEAMMRRAIRLAMTGRGKVEPNPMVGCVISRGGRIIGEGSHQRYGQAHAERVAMDNCRENPAGATAHVTLEPCSHRNKKTPPCVPALIDAKLARVVFGTIDPNPDVNGSGIAQLRQAGIDVAGPVLEPSARQLNAAYLARVLHRRPYVTLKWAESADGKVAAAAGQRLWITNRASNRIVHELRARCDAILVGINTVLSDNPLLTARTVPDPRPLERIVLDRDLRLPADCQLVHSADQGAVIVYCSSSAYHGKIERVASLASAGVMVKPLPLDADGRVSLPHALEDLGARPITHVLVEPGPTLAKSFLSAGLADRAWIFRSTQRIDDPTAPTAAPMMYPATGTVDIDGDRLSEHLNPASPVYFAPDPSADFVLLTDALLAAAP